MCNCNKQSQPSPASDQVAALDDLYAILIASSDEKHDAFVWLKKHINTIRTALSQPAQPVVSKQDARVALDYMEDIADGRFTSYSPDILEHNNQVRRRIETIRALLKREVGE